MASQAENTLLNRFGFSKGSVNSRIIISAFIVGSLTLVVKIGDAVKYLVLASQFGTGDALDAFVIAMLLPSFACNILGGSMGAAFVPEYVRVRLREGDEAAQRLLSTIAVLISLFLVSASVILVLIAPYIIPLLGSGFSAHKQTLTLRLFHFLVPFLFFMGISSLFSSVLSATKRFTLLSIAPLTTSVVVILFLLFGGRRLGIYALVEGTLVGSFLQMLLLAGGLRILGVSFQARWCAISSSVKTVARQYFPMTAGSFLMASTELVDQAMAAMLEPGSVSALNFGGRLVAFLIGIGSFALGTAVFPYFSEMVAKRDWASIKQTLRTYSMLILLGIVPLTILLIVFSTDIVRLLFERGEFTARDTFIVSRIQTCYLLQMPFFFLGAMIVRLISSFKANSVLMWGALINLILNVVLNYIFMQIFGIAGIALSTSAVYFVSFIYLLWQLFLRMRNVVACQ